MFLGEIFAIIFIMNIVTIPKKEYEELLRRQKKTERELSILKNIVESEMDETGIYPVVLKRWEHISNMMDRGKGRSFSSVKEMKKWLKGR